MSAILILFYIQWECEAKTICLLFALYLMYKNDTCPVSVSRLALLKGFRKQKSNNRHCYKSTFIYENSKKP